MEEVGKRNKIKIVLVSAISLGLLIIIFYSAYIWITQEVNPIEQVDSLFNKADNEDYIPPLNEDSNEPSGNSVGSGSSGTGAGGGGGSGSSGGDGSLLTKCSVPSILYSLEDITKEEICNLQVDGICVDKTISCSAEIHNGDPFDELFFALQLSFVENEKSMSEAIERRTKELTIAPSSFEIYNETLTIQSSGTEGIANKVINCFYNTVGSPTKEC